MWAEGEESQLIVGLRSQHSSAKADTQTQSSNFLHCQDSFFPHSLRTTSSKTCRAYSSERYCKTRHMGPGWVFYLLTLPISCRVTMCVHGKPPLHFSLQVLSFTGEKIKITELANNSLHQAASSFFKLGKLCTLCIVHLPVLKCHLGCFCLLSEPLLYPLGLQAHSL